MIWRKVCAAVMVMALALTSMPVAAQSVTAPGFQGLNQIEMALYGQVGEGPIIPRLAKAEMDVFGQAQESGSSIVARIDNLSQLVGASNAGVSLLLRLNALEWMTFQEVTQGQSLVRRIEAIERAFYGQLNNASISVRIADLSRAIWGTDQISITKKQIPAQTTVRISLLTEINSGTMRVGDQVRYKVTDTIILENTMLIPAGTQGVGKVTDVRQAGRIGRDGLVTVDWGHLTAVDGTQIKVGIGAAATERNQNSAEIAAGAAMAGVILLGPLGLAAGALVSGRDHVIPIGTQFYAEVAQAANVNGMSLIPVY